MEISKITSSGRLTIPMALRKKYNLKKGIKIAFIEKVDKLIVQPANKKYFHEIAGTLGLKGKMLKSLLEEKRC